MTSILKSISGLHKNKRFQNTGGTKLFFGVFRIICLPFNNLCIAYSVLEPKQVSLFCLNLACENILSLSRE